MVGVANGPTQSRRQPAHTHTRAMHSLLFNGSYVGCALRAATMSDTCVLLAAATGEFPRSYPQAQTFRSSITSQRSCRRRQARSSCRHEIETAHHCMIFITCIGFPGKRNRDSSLCTPTLGGRQGGYGRHARTCHSPSGRQLQSRSIAMHIPSQ